MSIKISHTIENDPISFNQWMKHIHTEYLKTTELVGRVKGYELGSQFPIESANNLKRAI